MHAIRLRKPWKAAWRSNNGSTADPGRRPAIYTRNFHRPTGLSIGQTLELALKFVPAEPIDPSREAKPSLMADQCHAWLNEVPIVWHHKADLTLSAPILDFVAAYNRLSLEIVFLSEPSADDMPPAPLEQLLEVELRICDAIER